MALLAPMEIPSVSSTITVNEGVSISLRTICRSMVTEVFGTAGGMAATCVLLAAGTTPA